jgi:hypothetical protein
VRTSALAAALLAILAAPLGAQNVHDVAAYFGTALTSGIEPPGVEQPMLGDNVNVWTLNPFYSHQSASYWGSSDPFGAFGVNAFGGSVSTSILAGRVGIEAMGGYLSFSCGSRCTGGFTGGGSALLRVLHAPLPFISGSRVTVSLRSAAAGSATDGNYVKYVSATAGLPIAISAPASTYRIVGFLTPGITWASVKAPGFIMPPSRPDTISQIIGGGSYQHDGGSGMLSGGLGLAPSTSGLGMSLGFQRIFVRRARTQFGATLTYKLSGRSNR